jgi:hypothetical protein
VASAFEHPNENEGETLFEGMMKIFIASKRLSSATLRQRYGDAHVIDVTSRGTEPWVRFSPFYPHGNIPVPFSSGVVSTSVEGIWQGLKVFEQMDVDPSRFAVVSMKGIKRSARKYGNVLGHRAGVAGVRLLSYIEARYLIYLPSYRWVLDHCLQEQLGDLQRLAAEKPLVLLDYETNVELEDCSRPLSHAGLVKRYLEGDWPV